MLIFDTITEDGIAKCNNYYSKTIMFEDVDYILLSMEEKYNVFSRYLEILNYFSSDMHVQLTFLNKKISGKDLIKKVSLKLKNDDIDQYRIEFSEMLREKIKKGENSIKRFMYITFSIKEKSIKKARSRLEKIELDVLANFKKNNINARTLDGKERLDIINYIINDKEELNFNYKTYKNTGLSIKDFVAPMGSLNFPKEIKIDDVFCSSFYFKIMGEELGDKVLRNFLDLDKKLLFNIHLTPIKQSIATSEASKKYTSLLGEKVTYQKKGAYEGLDSSILPLGLQDNLDQTERIIKSLKTRGEHMFLITPIVTCFGKTKKELNENINILTNVSQLENCELKNLIYQQESALNSACPLGLNMILKERGVLSSTVGIFIPFKIKELFSESEESLYYGVNTLTNNIIYADRKELGSPNGLILGIPGSGKSFSAKEELVNAYFKTKDDILGIDPEREFGELVKSLGGEVIVVSQNSKNHINILDIELNTSQEDNPISMKSDLILAFFEQIFYNSDGLTPIERAIIDRCVRLCYSRYMNSRLPEHIPILSDLYNYIKAQPEKEASYLATALEIFVNGSFNYFNNKTNVNLSNRLIFFDLKDLDVQLKKVGMLVVQEKIWNRIQKNRTLGKYTRTYMDEVHLLLKEKQTASYMVEHWKRQKKYGGIPTGITQNVKDFLASPEISSILENSSFIKMLNQGSGDADILASMLGLTEEQLKYVKNVSSGEGLIKWGGTIIPFKDSFPKETKLYKLMTTKLSETI